MAVHSSVKHLQVNKAQTTMLSVVALAVVITIFCLFGIKAMISKGAYQQRALTAKNKAISQLNSNYQAALALSKQYQTFAAQNPNIVGGQTDGSGPLDGNNAQIVLDALPSTYDAPALASSIEKVLSSNGLEIRSINVTDDPAANPSTASAAPTASPMNFSFEAVGTYKADQQTMQNFEHSIRPFDVATMELTGSDNQLQMSLTMHTYYQPAKTVNLTVEKAVK